MLYVAIQYAHDIQKTSPNSLVIFVSIDEATLWNIVGTTLLTIITSLREQFDNTPKTVLRLEFTRTVLMKMNCRVFVSLVLIGHHYINVQNAHFFN